MPAPGLLACPCCGWKTVPERHGSDDICPICFWHDDGVQLADPWFEGGANNVSLVQAQANFALCGASEGRVLPHVRAPHPHEQRDGTWRSVDASIDRPVSLRDAPLIPYWLRT